MKKILLLFTLFLSQWTISFSGPNWARITDWKSQDKSQTQTKITPAPVEIVPKQEQVKNTKINFKNDLEKTLWVALALCKIGFMPIIQHQNFTNALIAFQKHMKAKRQDGIICNDTVGKLNSMIIQHEERNPQLKNIQPPALPLDQPQDPAATNIYE